MSNRYPASARNFLDACRAGATADEMNALLAVVHEDYRKLRVARIEQLAQMVSARSTGAPKTVAADVETLLRLAVDLLDRA